MFRLSPQMFCLISLLFFASLANGLDTNLDETEKQFEAQFHIKYSNKTDEKKAAAQLSKAEKEINENNLKYLNGNSTFTLQLNQFSDLPKDLFEKEKLGLIPVTSQGRSLGLIVDPLQEKTTDPQLEEFYRSMSRKVTPEQWDSVSKGLVTSVKNQRSCGSCAAFSATSLHETCMLMSGARFNALDLSEQYIIDCGYNGMSMKGCHGASPNAYQDWFSNNGGQSPHEVDYPYLDINPNLRCPDNPKIFNSGAFVANSMADYNCNEDKMVQLVSKFGSVSTAIYAGDQSFGNLGMDVFSGCSNQQINHAVTVVGYGIENGLKYWLVKNSWGTYWGINGYFKIRRGTGECNIGSICVVSSCSKTNGKPSEPPVAPPPAPIPASQTCDVTSLFGPFVTGNYIFRVFSNGQQIQSYVSCTDSICRPSTAGPSNACIYICGRLQC